MPERDIAREALLRREYHAQTARIPWRDLQVHHARGRVVAVSPKLDLVEVAVQLGLDATNRLQPWIDAADIATVSDTQALDWHNADTKLWAVVAAPWVLVQQRDDDA